MTYNPNLIGVSGITQKQISNIILENLIAYYDWGFLNAGGFYNNFSNTNDIYTNKKNKLVPVSDPNYASGRVWHTYRQNLVWETGISFSTQPISISGVYVNNSFLPYSYVSASGKYVGSGYVIDYPNGRVIFDSPISTTGNVTMNYSSKLVKVAPAKNYFYFKQLQMGSPKADAGFINSSGDWVILDQNRIQMPAVFIEHGRTNNYPAQLGGGQWRENSYVFYVFSNNNSICADLLDVIVNQNDRGIKLYNSNSVSSNSAYPINYNGELTSKTNIYPNLLNNYFYDNCYITNSRIDGITELGYDLFIGTAEVNTEIIMPALT